MGPDRPTAIHSERRLPGAYRVRAAHADAQRRIAAVAGFVAPPLVLTQALATLAGADDMRQRSFVTQVRAYQLALRARLYPLVQREAALPTPQGTIRGYYSLADPDIVTGSAMADASLVSRVTAVLPFAG